MTLKNKINFDKYNKDFLYCEKIIKENSKNFHTAFSQLTKDKSRAVYAIYAFCRRADDAIDKYKDISLIEEMILNLEFIQQNYSNMIYSLSQFSDIKNPDNAIWRALILSFQRYNLKFEPFFDLLIGQKLDLNFQQPKTEKELSEYSYYVAGSVGLMLLPILSKNADEIYKPAIKLGEAMQRTNILRDIGEDLLMDRIYIPETVLKKFNISKQSLENFHINEQFILMWEYEAKKAEKLYQESFTMIPLIDKNCQLALLSSALIYQEILTMIRKNHYLIFDRKISVPKNIKIKLIMKAKRILSEFDASTKNEKWTTIK